MIFSVSEVELLRLLRWCRYIAPSDFNTFSNQTVSTLQELKLVRSQRSTKYLTLTGKGNEFLEQYFTSIPERMPVSYKAHDALRRARISKIALTSYTAGLNVFDVDLLCLENKFQYFSQH